MVWFGLWYHACELIGESNLEFVVDGRVRSIGGASECLDRSEERNHVQDKREREIGKN